MLAFLLVKFCSAETGKLVLHQWTLKALTASLPDRQSTQQLLGAVQSDLTSSGVFSFLQRSVLVHPDGTVLWFCWFYFPLGKKEVRTTLFVHCLLLSRFVSRRSLVLFWGFLATDLNQLPWSNLPFTLSATSPPNPSTLSASMLRFALLLPSFLSPFPTFPFSLHFSAGLPPCDIQSIGTGMDGSHCWLFPL